MRSSYSTSTSSYAFLSGTSMATPHVAGAVALLWSAHPELQSDLPATEDVLNSSAHHILSNDCQSGPPATPNNSFGNGRLDILAAVNEAAPAFALVSAASVQDHGRQTFGVSMNVTGSPVAVECRSTRGRETLVFTFSDTVVSGNASLTSGSGRVSGTSFSGNTMIVSLTTVRDVQRITVTLSGATSGGGQVLSQTALSLDMLIGDVDGNDTVTSFDTQVTRDHVGMPVAIDDFRQDVRVDGVIDSADVRTVRRAEGASLPH